MGPTRVTPAHNTHNTLSQRGMSSRFIRGSMYEPTKAQAKTLAFIDNRTVTVIMTITTVYALFADDLRLALFPPGADPVFYGLSVIALVLFAAELVLNCFARRDYIWRFYFWLDVAATLSLIPDIGWFWEPIVGEDDSGSTSSSAIRAGRASRAGTKAGRIVRIVRLVRLVRIVKLYKHVTKSGDDDSGDDPINANQPSQVGKRLSDLTTRRLIVIVLSMLLVIPFFDVAAYADDFNEYQQYGLVSLHLLSFTTLATTASNVATTSQSIMRASVEDYARTAGPLLYFTVNNIQDPTLHHWLKSLVFTDVDGVTSQTSDDGWEYSDMQSLAEIDDNYRSTERNKLDITGCINGTSGLTLDTTDTCRTMAVFDIKEKSVLEALLNILKTIFVMAVLAGGSLVFAKDAENLVIQPIERMVSMVKQLAKNPLATVQQRSTRASVGGYETQLLEATLAKIGALLQIGFGEAGSQIIGSNMSSSGALNPMIKGRKMEGIFGFCDIRQFTDATECLQEEVMVFVNQIGEVVHTACHLYGGAANKNIGDAFLIVWQLPDTLHHPSAIVGASVRATATGDIMETKNIEEQPLAKHEVADNALYAFLKVIVDIHKSNEIGALHSYQKDPSIIARFSEGYSVRLGYGLHLGWAIEGAIGSRFKIDASYLSPNVNMAARLEAATKQYGTPLLISDSLISAASEAARNQCRLIDCVTVKGSEEPMKLYTSDVTNFPDSFGDPDIDIGPCRMSADFANDRQIAELSKDIPADFRAAFKDGIDAYLGGDWATAKERLLAAKAIRVDGPTQTILNVIDGHGGAAPEDWDGYRKLTEK